MARETLNPIQRELLGQFKDIKRVMDQNNIPYTMTCGSLLGTVRHKGFIPWDDDIDILLARDDFERFAQIYPAQADKRYKLTYTNTWTPRIMSNAADVQGAFTDLFILDRFPDSSVGRSIRVLTLRVLQGMLKGETDYSRFSFAQRCLLSVTRWMGLLFSVDTKTRWYHRVSTATKRSLKVHKSNGEFKHLPDALDPAVYRDLIEGDFEGLSVWIPRLYDQELTRFYGPDYMTPPPVNERSGRHTGI